MYTVILLGFVAVGIALAVMGARRGSKRLLALGAGLAVTTIALFALMSFWGEMLWFEEVGFARRFWTQILAQLGIGILGAIVAAALTWLLTMPARHHTPRARWFGVGIAALAGAIWGAGMTWSIALRWAMGVSTGLRDPVLGKDTGFYLFTLPFLDSLYSLLVVVALISVVLSMWVLGSTTIRPSIAISMANARRASSTIEDDSTEDLDDVPAPLTDMPPTHAGSAYRSLFVALGGFALVLAIGRVLAPYHLMYSRHGIVYGAGWTDVHIRLPVYYVTAALLVLAALVLLVPRITNALGWRLYNRFNRFNESPLEHAIAIAGVPAGVVALIWIVGLGALPALTQWLVVQPNELAMEKNYLRNNIELTRNGFGLGQAEIQEFPIEGDFTSKIAQDNDRLLSEVRVWDPHALDDVLEQFQELRLYYEVTSVDLDRYKLDGRYRQIMIASREMESSNLPAESRTFVNQHFKYTHGYGLVMAPVADFTPTGLPKLVLRDVPPVADYSSLRIQRPEIYFGELTNQYVVANSRTPEFDYPSGSTNVYSHYEGIGGVPLDSFWRKLLFGWKVGGTRLLFSDYPKADSRLMFRRNIVERVATVAPFLELDEDPYSVVVDGKIKWIIDAYTTSSYYPYSEPYSAGTTPTRQAATARGVKAQATARPTTPSQTSSSSASDQGAPEHRRLDGANYARNSVKAVVDAYDGTVSLYIFDPNDPIVQVWARIYPDLFRPMHDMPEGLRAHVRYPEALLHAQGTVFSKYHMTDPSVFYNQEDLWVRATEKYYDGIRPVEPYYVMWQPPGASEVEFILMQPFTPKNRQVLIGWLAGMCDGDNYGKIVAYRFPKDKWILGPQQVDTKIDQSPELSAQLTLWDQHGKRVIRGNVLAIPIAKTILYIEPIYIKAQTAAYPELRMVVLMHNDDMSYGATFTEALEGLVNGRPKPPPLSLDADAQGTTPMLTPAEAAQQANRAFEEYVRLTNEGQFAEAGKQLEILRDALKKLNGGGEGDQAPLPAR